MDNIEYMANQLNTGLNRRLLSRVPITTPISCNPFRREFTPKYFKAIVLLNGNEVDITRTCNANPKTGFIDYFIYNASGDVAMKVGRQPATERISGDVQVFIPPKYVCSGCARNNYKRRAWWLP